MLRMIVEWSLMSRYSPNSSLSSWFMFSGNGVGFLKRIFMCDFAVFEGQFLVKKEQVKVFTLLGQGTNPKWIQP